MPALRLAGALVGLLAFAASARADYSYPDVANAFEGYDLVVSDEFSGPTLNSTLWTPDWDCSGWGNGMRAAYTTSPNNLYLRNGMLHLRPICGRLQPNKSICQPFSGYPECACEPTNFNKMDATSAQITTRHKFAFHKGKFRVRAKMSTGYYTWPAFWLYKDWKKGEAMPLSSEIDIMEGVGKRPQWWTAVIHYLIKNPATGELEDKVRNENADWTSNLNENFHVYGLDWEDGVFVWTIDEVVMWRLNYSRIFQDPNNINVFDDGYFHILLDVAVGGRMFGIGYGNNRPSYEELCADGSSFTPTEIDWLRIYQLKGRHNFTFGEGPDLVRGSAAPGGAVEQGAACPFDGCIGSSWNDRVDRIEQATSAGGAAAPTRSVTRVAGQQQVSSTARAATATETIKPSSAGQTMGSLAALLGALLLGLLGLQV